MTIREAVLEATRQLEAAKVPDPRVDAELLAAHVANVSPMQARCMGSTQLTPEQEQRFASLLLSRTKRQPLQYLLGTQWFYGLPIEVDERVLIPRQETEELCQWGLQFLKDLPSPRVLDLCTGSGAIAVTIKHECPRADVTACDLSAIALQVAMQNAKRNRADIRFLQGDLWQPLSGMTFDLILSNPPYIPTADCELLQEEVQQEPRMALDGGNDGLAFYRRIAENARAHLNEGGMIAVEIGIHQQQDVAALFEMAGLRDVAARQDICGIARMVGARRRSEMHV